MPATSSLAEPCLGPDECQDLTRAGGPFLLFLPIEFDGKSELSSTLQPVTGASRFATVGDLRLHYLDFGQSPQSPADDPRPKMVCLHGGAAQAHWFDFVVEAFLGEYRVLSLDLRGHGDSDWGPGSDYSYRHYADDVGRFIKTLAIGPVVLAGHSMGGMVSLVTAAEYGAQIGTLIVIDSMMQMSPERASTLRGIGQGKGRSFTSREKYIAGFKIRPEGSSAQAEVVHHMAYTSCRQFEDGQWRNKFDRNVYAQRHPIDGYDYWARVQAPVLLVAGGNSDRITPEVRDRVRGVCPQVAMVKVPDSGHHVTLDNPIGYREAVSAYLQARRSTN